jgi:hypothetical protein
LVVKGSGVPVAVLPVGLFPDVHAAKAKLIPIITLSVPFFIPLLANRRTVDAQSLPLRPMKNSEDLAVLLKTLTPARKTSWQIVFDLQL